MLTYLISYMNGNVDSLSFITMLCVMVFVTVCCMPVHECAHAWVADKLGDPTGRLKGRITLNPMAHLSWQGTLMLFLFGFGYAKPVPINIRNFKKRKLYFGLSALAGPVSNLFLAVIFMFIGSVCSLLSVLRPDASAQTFEIATSFFVNVSYYNIALAVFNLIPFPPLDGSRIATMVLPDKIYYRIMQYERYLFYALFALIFFFNRIGISPIGRISDLIFQTIGTVAAVVVEAVYRLFV